MRDASDPFIEVMNDMATYARSMDSSEETNPAGAKVHGKAQIDCIRFAAPGEAPVLEALQRRSSLVWEEYREALLAHPDAISVTESEVEQHSVRVAVANDRIVGFCTTFPLDVATAEIDALFVEPDLMRNGIGRALITDASGVAIANGVTRLEVTGNPRAVEFYERVGFVADHEVPTRFGPGVRMHRAL